jgi:hypothetical protein
MKIPALIVNSAEAGDAGAAHDAKEHGFSLIVGRVAQGDPCAAQPDRSFLQGSEAYVASGFLPRHVGVACSLYIDNENLAANAEGLAALGHQGGLGSRFGPQAMIHGRRDQLDVQAGRKLHQRMQECRRIGTAGESHQHALAASKQRLLANGLQYLGKHLRACATSRHVPVAGGRQKSGAGDSHAAAGPATRAPPGQAACVGLRPQLRTRRPRAHPPPRRPRPVG